MENVKNVKNVSYENNGMNGLNGKYGPAPTKKELEQLRQQYAGMAMQGIISNPDYYAACEELSDEKNSGFADAAEVVAFEAKCFADNIIKILYPENKVD